MKKEYKIFILIEKILNTLNNSRLEYIKAADKSPYPEYKRFLNKTATTRNRLCQDLMVVFRLYYNAPENLVAPKDLPITIIHSTTDEIVPISASLNYVDRSENKINLIEVEDSHVLENSIELIISEANKLLNR